MHSIHQAWIVLAALSLLSSAVAAQDSDVDRKTVRVFIFAGQSNMVGSDSKVGDIERFPPFRGLEKAQPRVLFSYTIGREHKHTSNGWTELKPVDGVVGPELSFARKVSERTRAPVAIIKCAAGGTHLGGDWNPDEPSGFEMYPLALELVRSSLAELDRQKIPYRLEGFLWHQGENDQFDDTYRANYGKNLKRFLTRWREDLKAPDLRFYIGELCTKTIWGMDLRPSMDAIRRGQTEVAAADPHAVYVPTSHVGVEIGGGVGLHYHYGTLGQLEHGIEYADAYLESIGQGDPPRASLEKWPYATGSPVKLFVLAGHRNMEGERAFVQDLRGAKGGRALLRDEPKIAYRYSLGGGVRASKSWEPLGPAGYYDTFGPEVSFGRTLQKRAKGNIAIAKFTHSGSQIIDWTPEGSEAKARHLYPAFRQFIQESIQDLTDRGHEVELAGIFYHLGENDMSFGPYRRQAVPRLRTIVTQLRKDLERPDLVWFVSQQSPTDDESVNAIDVTTELVAFAASDEHVVHVPVYDLPGQEQKLVITTPGIVELGGRLAEAYLKQLRPTH